MKSSKTVDEIVKNTILTELSILTKISILIKISILTKISIWQKYQFDKNINFDQNVYFDNIVKMAKPSDYGSIILNHFLSYIVNSQTCELERNAKLIGLSGQPSVYTCVHPSRERSAALTPPVGSSGHCLSSAEQKGAASILDKGGIHVGSWRHPCWIWRKAQLYIMEGQHGRKPVSAQLAQAKQP